MPRRLRELRVNRKCAVVRDDAIRQAMNVGRLDQAATTEMIKFALDRGINFIDTADVYSRGERRDAGRRSAQGHPQRIGIGDQSTAADERYQLHFQRCDTREYHAGNREQSEAAANRLCRFVSGAWMGQQYAPGRNLATLDDLVRQGKVRHIGLSNYMAWQAATALGLQTQLRCKVRHGADVLRVGGTRFGA